MTKLFDALRRAGCGENKQGLVLIDGSESYRHWLEDDVIHFEVKSGNDAAFADQIVDFDAYGFARVTDIRNVPRDVRVLVMVPFNGYLQTLDLIAPAPTK